MPVKFADHLRTNAKTLDTQCTHCGAVLPLTPGPTLEMQNKLEAFGEEHSKCKPVVFEPGDRVSFCGEEATVVMNFGTQGVVEIPGEGKCTWYWTFQGERVIPVALVKRHKIHPED